MLSMGSHPVVANHSHPYCHSAMTSYSSMAMHAMVGHPMMVAMLIPILSAIQLWPPIHSWLHL